MASTTLSRTSFAPRRSDVERTAIASLVGLSLSLGYVVLAALQDPSAIVIGAVPLLVAGALSLGWRWAAPVGVLTSLLGTAALVGPEPEELVRLLGNPVQPLYSVMLLGFVSAALGLISSVAATRRAFARTHAPAHARWLRPVLTLAAGVAAGLLILGAVPRAATGASVSPAALDGLPTLKASGIAFEQSEIHVKAGETVALRLENADQVTHFFDVDDLGVHSTMLAGQDGLTVFTPTTPGTYLFYCAPHYDPTTGQGMRGSLVVE
jgi:plastocyanin